MPVIEGLMKYIRENNIPFHMPGHKNNRRGFAELELIRENLYKIDNTEVPGLDNLHIPEEMILEGQRMAARAYKAKESFFLVNGSTCGIYSMILGTTKPKDKIIVQRNCHRSIHMACLLGDLNVVYLNPSVLEGLNIAVSVNTNEVIKLMDENPDAKALVVTYPTYYGTCCDLESIAKEAHKRGMLLLVDEAHGAHLTFNKRLPKSSIECGADVSVVSLHKSTPALTQTSLLNIGSDINTDGIKFMLRLFQSSSPSYVFMASIDAARHIMESRGEALLDELLDNIEKFRKKLSSISDYVLLGREHIGKASIKDIDLTKIVISSPYGGRKLEKLLREEYKVQVEMSDIYNITLISSIGDNAESFNALYNALEDISNKYSHEKVKALEFKPVTYKRALNMRETYYRPKRRVKLKEAKGLISGEMVAPYPPGIPVLLMGEIITSDIIEHINICKEYGIPLNGISDSSAEYIEVIDA